jgi:metal-sulfur cluster biosynthetic enzyme
MPEWIAQTRSDVRERVVEAFRSVEDPCSVSMRAGWSLLDLGLLVDTWMDDDELVIEVALTDPFCPFYDVLEEQIVASVTATTEVASARVEVSGKVAWDPSRARKGPLAAHDKDDGPERRALDAGAEQPRGDGS